MKDVESYLVSKLLHGLLNLVNSDLWALAEHALSPW